MLGTRGVSIATAMANARCVDYTRASYVTAPIHFGTVMFYSPPRYRPEIDGLRAIAVLCVIFFHSGFESFSGGYIGVDVFFVISGYLITGILIAEQTHGGIQIANFYRRRARRILPALFFMIGTTVPAAWLLLPPVEFADYLQSITATALFSSNIFFWYTSGYWDTATALKPLIHTWSLAVEEQYYVIFPFVIMLGWRFGIARISALLIVAAGVSLWLSERLLVNHSMLSFYMLPPRAWELLIGALVAIAHYRVPTHGIPPRVQESIALLGIALIGYAAVTYTEQRSFPGLAAVIPVSGTVLVVFSATRETFVGAALASRPCVAIGLASYSAYLWHQPVLAFMATHAGGQLTPGSTAFALAVTAALSAFSYRWVEKPVRHGRSPLGRRPLRTALWLSGVFVGASAVAQLGEGFPDRLNSVYSAQARAVETTNVRSFVADTAPGSQKPVVLIIGDSYVTNWSIGLREKIDQHRYRVVSASYLWCNVSTRPGSFDVTPLAASSNKRCAYLSNVLGDGDLISRVQYIFLTSYRPYSYGANLFRFELLRAIAEKSSAPAIYVFGNYFQFTNDKQTCLNTMFTSKSNASACVNAADFIGTEAAHTVEPSGIDYHYVDIKKLMCGPDLDTCPYEADGVPYMLDNNHLTATFAKLMARRIVEANPEYFSTIGLADVFGIAKQQPPRVPPIAGRLGD